MVRTREEAAHVAENIRSVSRLGICQLFTRTCFAAPSAGDQDGDGDADAVDGWKSEPSWARHPRDRNPPRGVPLAWSGGRKGYGHRAISIGDGQIRSTDVPRGLQVSTVDLIYIEQHWGLHYLGWSETIDGILIPLDNKPKPPKEKPVPDKVVPSLDATLEETAKDLQQALTALTKYLDARPENHGDVYKLRQKLRSLRDNELAELL